MSDVRKTNELIERLAEYFGSDTLPRDLQDLVDRDPEAARLWTECQSMSAVVGDADPGDNFSDVELAEATARVEGRIEERPQIVALPYSWMKVMTRIAAAVLLVAVSYTSYEVGRLGVDATTDYDGMTASMEEYGWSDLYSVPEDADPSDSTMYSLDDDMVGVLLEEYTSKVYFRAGEQLLGDLTEQELEYLEENLTVGDIL